MKNESHMAQYVIQKYGAFIALVLLVIVNCFITPNFMNVSTFWNLMNQSTTVMILGLGMVIVIATGGINISVGSVMALSAMALAKIVFQKQIVLGIIVCLLIAAFTGAITGLIITKFKIQPMIATMAMMYMLRGVAKLANGGTAMNYKNPQFSNIAYIKIAGQVPIQFLLVSILVFLVYILIKKTPFGSYVEAYGDNPQATRAAGINVILIVTVCYVICNLLAGISGIMEAIATTCADPVNMGLNKETDAIAAVVVGGTPMSGGKPNIPGMICGVLVLQLITIMINMNNIPYSYSLVIKALIIAVSLYVQNANKKQI